MSSIVYLLASETIIGKESKVRTHRGQACKRIIQLANGEDWPSPIYGWIISGGDVENFMASTESQQKILEKLLVLLGAV